jgi:hypothetical protein
MIDSQRLSIVANEFEKEMRGFYRDLAAIPCGLSRIGREMGRLDLEEIRTGPDHLLGRAGSGKRVIVMEARANPGHAAAMAGMLYAGKLIHELGMYDDFTLWVAASEHHAARPEDLRPECILFAEPTDLRIYRGVDDTTDLLEESHPLVRAAIATYETLFELPPVIGKRNGSANGSGHHAPGIAFGPTDERHLLKAAQFYAAFPAIFAGIATRH